MNNKKLQLLGVFLLFQTLIDYKSFASLPTDYYFFVILVA